MNKYITGNDILAVTKKKSTYKGKLSTGQICCWILLNSLESSSHNTSQNIAWNKTADILLISHFKDGTSLIHKVNKDILTKKLCTNFSDGNICKMYHNYSYKPNARIH